MQPTVAGLDFGRGDNLHLVLNKSHIGVVHRNCVLKLVLACVLLQLISVDRGTF
jgi:hypothetical protein